MGACRSVMTRLSKRLIQVKRNVSLSLSSGKPEVHSPQHESRSEDPILESSGLLPIDTVTLWLPEALEVPFLGPCQFRYRLRYLFEPYHFFNVA